MRLARQSGFALLLVLFAPGDYGSGRHAHHPGYFAHAMSLAQQRHSVTPPTLQFLGSSLWSHTCEYRLNGQILFSKTKLNNGANGYNQTVLELSAPGSGSRVLKIKDPDGLDPGQGAIKLNKSTELWHLGGGVMSVWGDVIFDSTNATAAQRPQFVLGNGTTLYVRYKNSGDPENSFKSVGEQGGLIRGAVGGPDLEESLVLRPDLRGSFAVDVGLVSLGEITTDDGSSDTANTIRLSCLPKVCIGEMPSAEPLLRAVGVEGKLGTIIIDAVTCIRRNARESDSVKIDAFGVLKINRHCVMPTSFLLYPGGKVEVKAKILLAVGGILPTCAAAE